MTPMYDNVKSIESTARASRKIFDFSRSSARPHANGGADVLQIIDAL